MALKFFLIYIGGFLASSIVLVAIVKQYAEGFAAGGKKPLAAGGLSSLLISGLAYLSVLFTSNLFIVFWILSGIFLLFGIAHLLLFKKKYFYSEEDNQLKIFIAEILFCLALLFFTVVIFSSLQYFITKEKDFLYFPMLMSMLAFFIPLAILQTFNAAYNIPAAQFELWQYPLNVPIDLPDESPGEKILVVAFEISKKKADPAKTNFRAKGPDTMKLGDLYYHFINDYNDSQSETPIMYAESDHTSYDWWFRKKKKWFQKQTIFDPQLTIRENKIKENTVIICERMDN